MGDLGHLFDSILIHLPFSDLILAFYSKLKPKILAIMIWIWLILQALATIFPQETYEIILGKNHTPIKFLKNH